MICSKHGIEMNEYGDDPDSIWFCSECEVEKEMEVAALNEPDEWNDETPSDEPFCYYCAGTRLANDGFHDCPVCMGDVDYDTNHDEYD